MAKKGKRYTLTLCRVCKWQDIEEYKPKRVWNVGKERFEEEDGPSFIED